MLYSFLRLLTLQIGLAVLAIFFLIAACTIALANVFDITGNHMAGTPTNYIILSIFAILLLLTGLLMFAAAYTEKRQFCLYALVFLVIALILFVILSGISFFNEPSLNNKVCFYGHKCPESLWLPRLKYKTNDGHVYIAPDDHDDTTETIWTNKNRTGVATKKVDTKTTIHGGGNRHIAQTTTAVTTNSTTQEPTTAAPGARFRGKGKKRRRGKPKKTRTTAIPPLDTLQGSKNDRTDIIGPPPTRASKRLNKNGKGDRIYLSDSPGNVFQTGLESTESKDQSSLGTIHPAFVDDKDDEGIFKIVKRSVFSIAKGDDSKKRLKERHPIIKENADEEEDYYTDEFNQHKTDEEETKEDTSGYDSQKRLKERHPKMKEYADEEEYYTDQVNQHDTDVEKRNEDTSDNNYPKRLKGRHQKIKEYADEEEENYTDEVYHEDVDEEDKTKETSNYIFGLHFVLAIIVFIILVLCFIFTMLVVWSYMKQLQYIKLYSVNPSSTNYIVP